MRDSFLLKEKTWVRGIFRGFSLSFVHEDVTEVHSHLSLAVLGQREVDCRKIVVMLTRGEQMERFDVLSLDKLMSGN